MILKHLVPHFSHWRIPAAALYNAHAAQLPANKRIMVCVIATNYCWAEIALTTVTVLFRHYRHRDWWWQLFHRMAASTFPLWSFLNVSCFSGVLLPKPVSVQSFRHQNQHTLPNTKYQLFLPLVSFAKAANVRCVVYIPSVTAMFEDNCIPRCNIITRFSSTSERWKSFRWYLAILSTCVSFHRINMLEFTQRAVIWPLHDAWIPCVFCYSLSLFWRHLKCSLSLTNNDTGYIIAHYECIVFCLLVWWL